VAARLSSPTAGKRGWERAEGGCVARWIIVLMALTLLTGALTFGLIPTLAIGLTRILFCVYASLLAGSLLIAIIRI
jgi:uncharacterized membrane protein YtjA (UPF0391 family)